MVVLAKNAMALDEDRHPEAIELEGDEDDSLLNEAVHVRRPPLPGNRLKRLCTFSIWWWTTNVVMLAVIIYLALELDSRKNLLSRFELAGDISRIGPRRMNYLALRTIDADDEIQCRTKASLFMQKRSTRQTYRLRHSRRTPRIYGSLSCLVS